MIEKEIIDKETQDNKNSLEAKYSLYERLTKYQ